MEVSAALTIAVELLRQHGLLAQRWTVKFDNARKRFGYCDDRKRIISVSRPLVKLNTEEQVLETIRHEVAHALAGSDAGHGPKWKAMARSIGCNAERCYDDTTTVQPLPRYQAVCRFCFRVSSREKMPRRIISCGACQPHSYNEKYRLHFRPTDPKRVYFPVSLKTTQEIFQGTISICPDQIRGRVKVDGQLVPAIFREVQSGDEKIPCLVIPKDTLPPSFCERYPRSSTQDALLRFAPRCQASFRNLLHTIEENI